MLTKTKPVYREEESILNFLQRRQSNLLYHAGTAVLGRVTNLPRWRHSAWYQHRDMTPG